MTTITRTRAIHLLEDIGESVDFIRIARAKTTDQFVIDALDMAEKWAMRHHTQLVEAANREKQEIAGGFDKNLSARIADLAERITLAPFREVTDMLRIGDFYDAEDVAADLREAAFRLAP